jgi:DNA-binding NarL/FixJ family response regulator
MKKITVAVVEDSEKLQRGLAALINDAPDLRFHSAWGNAEEALQRLPDDAPNIVLMDIRLPGMSGIECVKQLSVLLPKSRILMLTAYEDSEDIFQSLAAGAHGYLVKSAAPEQLLEAIREVAAGGSPISGSVARKMVDFFRTRPAISDGAALLSPREREVLRLLADGCPYKEIATAMKVTLGTIQTYIERIYEKLHVHSRTEAVVKYLGHPPASFAKKK